MKINKMSLGSSAIVSALGLIALFLVIVSTGGQFLKFVFGYERLSGLIPFVYVDHERNIPTYFSVILLLLVALLLVFITVLNKKQAVPHTSKWAVLSFGFFIMAFDEAFRLHEKMVAPLRGMLGDGDLGIFYYSWVIPGIVTVCALGVFFLKFLMYLPAPTRLRFLIAGTLYVGGAIGFELIGGYYAESYSKHNLIYSMISTVEESLEMAGLIVFIWALLKYCSSKYKEVRVVFE